MNKLLVIAENDVNLSFIKGPFDFIKLRQKGDLEHMMKVFEYQDTYRAVTLREDIEKRNPDYIVVIGKLKDYRWLASVVCRIFGHFISWMDQRDNSYGSTKFKMNTKEVELFAFDSLEDWRVYYEVVTE